MINIHCALMCEAKPLIHALKLKHVAVPVFRLYENDSARLIVSGVGKANAAAAVAYMHGRHAEEASPWLNVGVCGAGEAELGEVFLVNKVTEASSGKTWYPPQVLNASIPSSSLISYEHASADYSHDSLMDMESAGFCEISSRFVTGETAQLVKVVSDNKYAGSENISEKYVEKLIESRVGELLTILDSLGDVNEPLIMDARVKQAHEETMSRWHVTAYQSKQLQRMLEQYFALHPDEQIMPEEYVLQRSSRFAVVWLQNYLNAMVLNL